MSEDNPHVFQGGWPGVLSIGESTFQPNLVIQTNDSKPLVVISPDGKVEVTDPDKLDQAALAFWAAVQERFDRENPHVVRKRGVSEFMTICMGKVDWTQNNKLATYFARKADADEAAIGLDAEVVPARLAMVF
jgi:hypothetical protein